MNKVSLFLLLTLFSYSTIQAGTYDNVVNILNTSCAFSSCHDSTNPAAGLDFSLSANEIYSQIVNVNPQNPTAASKNNKLIKPGDPGRSFLYRKMNYGLHADSELTAGENDGMPTGGALDNHQIELVRQWILFGAKNDDETYVNPAVLEEYYTEGGLDQIEAPEAPAAGEGYQIQLGPIFLAPGEEREFVYRYELQNEEPLEVNKVQVEMNQQSHHFLFFKFKEGEEFAQADGLIGVTGFGQGSGQAITSDTKMVGGWAYSRELMLPEGTAFSWQQNQVLKLNYHILNYSATGVLPATLYVNVYTQPEGTALMEMHSEFHLSIEESQTAGLLYPPGISEHTWEMSNFEESNGNNDTIHIWTLGSHTHKYGVDFDIYLNDDGQHGEQVYEGFYNLDYTTLLNYYNYAEPPFRIFDEFLSIRDGDGLIIEGVYDNTSNQFVTAGLTTDDEMFGVFMNYLVGDISVLEQDTTPVVSIESLDELKTWSIYPNPTDGEININLPKNMEDLNVEVYNTAGELMFGESIINGAKEWNVNLNNFDNGIYIIQLNSPHFNEVRKITLHR